MTPKIRAQIKALGTELAPPMLQGSQSLCAAMAPPLDPSITITRDEFYGPDERNRLDIFRMAATQNAPVLVFVHGGGFVMGDKTSPGSPFYDHIAGWAAQQGWVGVNLTYKLAPAHKWPSGPQDMALAAGWIRENIAQYGGNPDAIFLMGQSAGAAHVASYVSHPEFHTGGGMGGTGIAGALMISGIYDTVTATPNQFNAAYYGDDPAQYPAASTTPGLLGSDLPMLFSVSEFDAMDFQKQAAQFAGDWQAARGNYPPMHWLDGHNHLTPVLAIGSNVDTLGPIVRRFVQNCAAA